MRARLGWVAPPEPGAEEEDDEIVRVSIQELRSFLECPMQASARRHAGLRPECADAMLQESESFEADALASHRLLPAVFWSKLRRQRAEKRAIDFDEEYDALARPLELTGRLPTGPFFHATRARHIERLNTWQDNLIELGYGASPRVRRRGFGVCEILDGVDAARAPLELRVELGGRTRRVEIVGRTGPIVTDWEWPTVIQLVGARLAELPQKYFMRGFLDQVVVTAAGEGGERPWSVLLSPADLAGRGRRSKCVRRFHPLDQDRALTYIRDLVAQLLSGFQGYYFPIEAILESASRSEELPAALEKKRADPYRMTSSDYGPILNPRGYPIASDPITLAARRFSLYFETSIDR